MGHDSQGSCHWSHPYLCFAKETCTFDCLQAPRDIWIHWESGKFSYRQWEGIHCKVCPSVALEPQSNIITVTGRPRRPRDQRSVKNVNKLVKRILGTILADRRLAGQNPNWTELLGRVPAAINSQCGQSRMKYLHMKLSMKTNLTTPCLAPNQRHAIAGLSLSTSR